MVAIVVSLIVAYFVHPFGWSVVAAINASVVALLACLLNARLCKCVEQQRMEGNNALVEIEATFVTQDVVDQCLRKYAQYPNHKAFWHAHRLARDRAYRVRSNPADYK